MLISKLSQENFVNDDGVKRFCDTLATVNKPVLCKTKHGRGN